MRTCYPIGGTRRALVSVFCLLSACSYAQTHLVRMATDQSGAPRFEPDYIQIDPHDTVVWKNTDMNIAHNIVAEPNGIPKGAELFSSPLIEKPGADWSRKFTQVGTYRYHCHPHAEKGMTGTIVVGRESAPGELRMDGDPGQAQHHRTPGGHAHAH